MTKTTVPWFLQWNQRQHQRKGERYATIQLRTAHSSTPKCDSATVRDTTQNGKTGTFLHLASGRERLAIRHKKVPNWR